MRKLVRRVPYMHTLRASVPEYRPEASDQKFKSWWSRLNSLSNKPASKVYLAQLANLFAYYNRQVEDTVKVDFNSLSPSTSMLGEARSSPRDSSIRSRPTMKVSALRSTTFTESSIPSSLRIPKLSTKSY